jgi:hypothetical protein
MDVLEIILIVMSNEIKLHIVTFVAFIIGVLEATGHLDTNTGNSLTADANVFGGIVIAAISLVYEAEHLLFQVKEDAKHITWEGQPPVTPTPTTTTTTTTPTA